jgi:hypothetical protein
VKGGGLMNNDGIEDILSGKNPDAKRELLDSLVTNLLSDLNETEKKSLLQRLLTGRKDSRELATMVEH